MSVVAMAPRPQPKAHLCMIEASQEALGQCTDEQAAAIVRLARQAQCHLLVTTASFDLPPQYLTFRQTFRDGHLIYGGIDADGLVST